MKAFEGWVQSTLPEHVEHQLSVHGKAAATKVNLNTTYHQKAEKILRAIRDKDVFYKYSG